MRTTRTALLFIVVLGLNMSPVWADTWGPWEVRAQKALTTEADRTPLDIAVRFFQKNISPIDGARCPMYPTCSAYARQSLSKHGPLWGIFMTADRLIREGDPIEQRTPIVKWGYTRFYDPLTDNDFWLKNKK